MKNFLYGSFVIFIAYISIFIPIVFITLLYSITTTYIEKDLIVKIPYVGTTLYGIGVIIISSVIGFIYIMTYSRTAKYLTSDKLSESRIFKQCLFWFFIVVMTMATIKLFQNFPNTWDLILRNVTAIIAGLSIKPQKISAFKIKLSRQKDLIYFFDNNVEKKEDIEFFLKNDLDTVTYTYKENSSNIIITAKWSGTRGQKSGEAWYQIKVLYSARIICKKVKERVLDDSIIHFKIVPENFNKKVYLPGKDNKPGLLISCGSVALGYLKCYTFDKNKKLKECV